ncbi:MAG: hypothetical protein IPJ65_31180 [Archangiaceae bacterium]|nr:hypothetical protein [Archangiaceae bacterium]
MRLILKPLAAKHHAELQRLTDAATERWPDALSASDAFTVMRREDLDYLPFAFARQVMALGGWGWWSLSPDGRLNPTLVSWNKAWFIVPIDCVLTGQAARVLEKLRTLPPGDAGSLTEVVVDAQ